MHYSNDSYYSLKIVWAVHGLVLQLFNVLRRNKVQLFLNNIGFERINTLDQLDHFFAFTMFREKQFPGRSRHPIGLWPDHHGEAPRQLLLTKTLWPTHAKMNQSPTRRQKRTGWNTSHDVMCSTKMCSTKLTHLLFPGCRSKSAHLPRSLGSSSSKARPKPAMICISLKT